MNFEQRMFVRLKLYDMLIDLHGQAFQQFFHDLMCARYPDFLPVRTAGSLGDEGADGLSLHSGRLYACYGPETFDASEVRRKFETDLRTAVEKRWGQFSIFVFVHNDRRGMHPQVASQLVLAQARHPDLGFEQMGRRRLRDELMQLSKIQTEEVLRCPVPVEPMVYGVGMEELAELLDHLRGQRMKADPLMPLDEVSELKLDYNALDSDSRREMVHALMYTHLVEEFYDRRIDVQEADEVAAGFTSYYRFVRSEHDDPEDVLSELQMYVLGNRHQPPRVRRLASVVLAYFFERCHIFEAPPPGWHRSGETVRPVE